MRWVSFGRKSAGYFMAQKETGHSTKLGEGAALPVQRAGGLHQQTSPTRSVSPTKPTVLIHDEY